MGSGKKSKNQEASSPFIKHLRVFFVSKIKISQCDKSDVESNQFEKVTYPFNSTAFMTLISIIWVCKKRREKKLLAFYSRKLLKAFQKIKTLSDCNEIWTLLTIKLSKTLEKGWQTISEFFACLFVSLFVLFICYCYCCWCCFALFLYFCCFFWVILICGN